MDETRIDAMLRGMGRGKTRRGVLAALGGLGLVAAPGVIGAKSKKKARGHRVSAAAAPKPVNDVFDLPAGEPFCDFPVRLAVSGKTKTIELPGQRTIITAPGQNAVLTNLDEPEKQVTLNITGSFHQTTLANGDVETVATGRNILVDPVSEPHFALTRGRFTYVLDENDNLVQPRSGKGNLTDVCVLLS